MGKKFGDFIERNKRALIIIAGILVALGFVGAVLYTYCEGAAAASGLIFGLIFLSAGAIIFTVLGIRAERLEKSQRIARRDGKEGGRPPRRKPDKADKVILAVMIASGVLCIAGILLILCDIVAVRIAGIVLSGLFGLIMIVCVLLIRFFVSLE